MPTLAEKVAAKAQEGREEAEALALVAQNPAFAGLPVSLAYWSRKTGVTLVCRVADRAALVALWEGLTATCEPLPVLAYRGTFAGVKPAVDYEARDGEVLIDAASALPLAYDVSGFEAFKGAQETLRATFETATDRINLRIQIDHGPATAREEVDRDSRGNIVARRWPWSGLPNCSERFRYSSGAGDNAHACNWCFAFDTSTDLAAWLAGAREG